MNDLLTISDGHLIGLSGISVFKSGLEYFQSGHVVEYSAKAGVISGLVSGKSLYKVKLRHTAKHLEGQCDCPESSETDFCKHSVALAMHYRRQLSEHNTLASGDVLDRIRAFINSMTKNELQEALQEIIEDDRGLHTRWSVRADLALNKVDSKLIRKRITAAFPYNKRLYRRGQARQYFTKAGAEVELLEKQLPKLDAKKALQLLDYAFQRLHRALQTIDDSNDYRHNLQITLQRLHIATLARSDWNQNRIVGYLKEIEKYPAHDFYPDIPGDYTANLPEEVHRLYLNSKQEKWDSLPQLPAGASWEQLEPYLKIQRHLLKDARHKNNSLAEIALLEKICVDTQSCLVLCQRLLEVGNWDRLGFWLNKANSWDKIRSTPGQLPNLELKRLSTQLYMHQERNNDSLELQWEIYQQSEVIDDYKQLIHFANLDNSEERWKARVFRRLHKIIEDPPTGHFVQRTLNHLVELYMLERQPEAALDLVNYHSLSYQALDQLIKAFSSQPEITYPLYQQQLSLLLSQANNHAYKEAVSLIIGIKNKLKTQDQHHFDVLLDTVNREHSDKPAFKNILEEALVLN